MYNLTYCRCIDAEIEYISVGISAHSIVYTIYSHKQNAQKLYGVIRVPIMGSGVLDAKHVNV